MYDRTGNYLIIAIIIGMILGVAAVALFGEAVMPVKFLGDIFLNALMMVVIPLLFASMVVGITSLGDVRKLGRTGLKTVLYFLATSSISVIIGLILVNVFRPGAGVTLTGGETPVLGNYSFLEWITAQIPPNIVAAAAEMQVLPIIIFALIFGGVLTTVGSKGKPVIAFFDGVNEVIMKIVHLIMWFAPIGIFGLVAGQLAEHGGLAGMSSIISGLWKYVLVVILGLAIHAVVILPLIARFFAGKNPIEYFIGVSQAIMTAFATASSSATLPVTMDCVENKNDVDKRASSFVLPLGATINMDGTALYEAVAAMFIAQAYGIDLSIFAQLTIFATAVLASIGAAGIPQAGLVTMVLVLQAVGLPLEGIGLILAIDWFLDRCRTAVNVWGDSIGAAVIATTSEIGLVDRRRKQTRQSRDRSSSRSSYRDNTRGRRTTSKDKDRKDTRGRWKKDSPRTQRSSQRGDSRRDSTTRRDSRADSTRRDSRSDNSRSDNSRRESKPKKQFSRQGDPGGSFKMTEQKEVYSPDSLHSDALKAKESAAASSSVDTRGKQKLPASKTDNEKTERTTRGRSGYGRKPSRSRASDRKDNENKVVEKADQEPLGIEPTTEKVSSPEPSGEFTIPKFPDKILDELASAPADQEDFVPEADQGMSQFAEDSTGGTTPYQAPIEFAHDSDDATVSEPKESDSVNEVDETRDKSEDTFSTLDKIVLGDEKTTDDSDPAQSKGESLEAESKRGAEKPVESKDETEIPQAPEVTVDSAIADETPNIVDESAAVTDDVVETARFQSPPPIVIDSSESEIQSDDDSRITGKSDDSPEEAEASEVEQPTSPSTDEDESQETGNSKMRYGRPKKKKISR